MMESLEGCDDRGAMAALFPVTAEIAQELCSQVRAATGGLVCQVANYNSSKQVCIAFRFCSILHPLSYVRIGCH